MAFMIVREDETWFAINVWNWGPIHELLHRSRPAGIDLEKMDLIRMTVGATLEPAEVRALLAFLEQLLVSFDGRRLMLNGELRADADDGVFHRDRPEENYSLDGDALRKLIDFLKGSSGPLWMG